MDAKERENFNRNSTLIVDHTRTGLTDLIELNASPPLAGHGSFEAFINAHQHEIYHLCYNKYRCCQCPPGYTLPSNRVLHSSQLELLLDKGGPKNILHKPGRTADFCCCLAHVGLMTNELDVTLARCLLVNFCKDVFWFSCLKAQKQTFEDFLSHNKHQIYHLYDINRCCQCYPGFVYPTQRSVITGAQWKQLFSTRSPPCPLDIYSKQSICSSSVTCGITVGLIGADLSRILLEFCCPLKREIENLVQLRNNVFGHAKEAKISDSNYKQYKTDIVSSLLVIARICNKEKDVQNQIDDLEKRTLDGTLLLQTIKEELLTREAIETRIEQESTNIKQEIMSGITQESANVKEGIETKVAQESAGIKKEIMSGISQESANVKDGIETRIAQESTDIKKEIMSGISQASTNTKEVIETRMAQESTDIKKEIMYGISQEGATVKGGIETRMAQESADIKKEIMSGISQESANVKEGIETRMAQESADIKKEIMSGISQESANVKEGIETRIVQESKSIKKDIMSGITQESANVKEGIETKMTQESAGIKKEIMSGILQESTNVKEGIETKMAQESAGIKKEIMYGISQESANIKDGIETRIAQESTDIKKEIMSGILQASTNTKEVIETRMTQESTNIKKEIMSGISQESANVKEGIETRMAQESTDIKKEIMSGISQESANVKEGIETRMAQESADIKKEIMFGISQESANVKEEIETRMAQESTDIKKEIMSGISQESANVKEGIETRMEQDSTDIKKMIKQGSTDITKEITRLIKIENAGTKEYTDKKLEEKSWDSVRKQIEEKRQRLLDHTEKSIKTHCDEHTFVQTNAVDEALMRVKQHGIVVLIGSPGIGKSRIGLELLRKLSAGVDGYQSIQLDDVTKWQDMGEGMDVVFIDDVFGSSNCSYNNNVHAKLMKLIFTTIKNENVKVILTLRSNIYRTIAGDIERFRIFHDRNILDLSLNEFQMTVEEKKSCLMNYLTLNKIIATDDPNLENYSNASMNDLSLTVYIHEDTIDKITTTDVGTSIGFPEACFLFSSHLKFTMQGPNFFCHPTKLLLDEMTKMRMDGKKSEESMIDFTLLVYVLLRDNSVNIYDIDMDAFGTIMKTLYAKPPAPADIPISYISDSIERLFGNYLKINNDGNYCFQHRLISEAVMISYNITGPRRVIPLLGFDFITEMVRPQSYQTKVGEVTFTVPVKFYDLLARRSLKLLETDYTEHPWLFAQSLCRSMVITLTGKDILRELIDQYKKTVTQYTVTNNDGRFITTYRSIHDHRFFKSRDSYFTVYSGDFYLPSALVAFCNTDNDSLYHCLYNSINNTLHFKSYWDEMVACRKTLMTAFEYAVCTLDKKRSAVVLKMLKDHNINQKDITLHSLFDDFKEENYPTFSFGENIVRCQGVPGVQLLLRFHDLCHVFNMSSLFRKVFNQLTYDKTKRDCNMYQFITSEIVSHINNRPVLVNDITGLVCRKCDLDCVKSVCESFDSSLFEVDDMILKAYEGRHIDTIQWLMEKYRGLYDIQRVLNKIPQMQDYYFFEGFQVMLDNCDHSSIDMGLLMNNVCGIWRFFY